LLNYNNKLSKNSPHAAVEQKEVQLTKYLPDTTINGILKLENYLSVKKFSIHNNKFEYVEKIRESPVVIFFNNDLKEYLLAYQYEGGVRGAFDCFEIGYNKDSTLSKYPHIKTNYASFQTESRISLGLTLKELVGIKGDSYTKNNKQFMIRYEINAIEPFLKRYNMPSYFMEIELKNNYVDKIKFGFGYP
jgi:hypothetical protein